LALLGAHHILHVSRIRVKLKYSVKIMGNCDEGKGTTSKITKSMCCSFDTDIKLTVIKPATAQWRGNSVLQNGT